MPKSLRLRTNTPAAVRATASWLTLVITRAHTGGYSTVGQLYEALERAVVSLSSTSGEKSLFCGSATLQISPEDLQIKGLRLVNSKASALDVLGLIVEQGEGARTTKGSHFEKFNQIAEQYDCLLRKNSTFEPGRPLETP